MISRSFLSFGLGVFLIAFDLCSKAFALSSHVGVINTGLSFGLFPALPWDIVLLILLTMLLIYWRTVQGEARWALALLYAGGLGNLISRLIWGGVVDWLPLPFGGQNNLADWSIFFGLLWWALIQYRSE